MTTEDLQVPKMYEHVLGVYESMLRHAQEQDFGTVDHNGHDDILWDGFTTALFRNLEIPVPYYGKVFKYLTELGCMIQIRRGGGTASSRWQVCPVTPPQAEQFMQRFPASTVTRFQPVVELQTMRQQLDDVVDNIGGVNIRQALSDLQRQFTNHMKEYHEPARPEAEDNTRSDPGLTDGDREGGTPVPADGAAGHLVPEE